MKNLLKTKLPKFELNAYDPENDEFIVVKSQDLVDKWSVLFFYPADFTFVCPTELEDLASYHSDLKKIGVEVLSVSKDTHFVHKGWHDNSEKIKKIKYKMLSDPKAKLAKKLGVYNNENAVAERATFVFDPNGNLKLIEINDDGIGRGAKELVRKIKAAQYVAKNPNAACQANWEEGKDEALEPSIDLVGKL